MRIAPLALLIAVACPAVADETEGTQMAFEYGFRYDPMGFVENSDTLQAALVRRHVFNIARPGDEALLHARIEEILAGQREDGSLGDPGHDKAEKLIELADLGADPERPEVKRAIEAALRGTEDEPGPWIRDIRALCLFGVTDPPEVRAALQDILDSEEEWNGPYKICPWGQAFYLRALWPAREVLDTRDICVRTLTWMIEGLNDAGCISYKDPWGLIWAAGIIDLPEAKRLVELEVPTILRGQEPDGGWGDNPHGAWSKNSLKVFQALANHGLFETLRELPPLPPDWRVVREIPAPEGDLWTMTYDGERLWVLDREARESIAFSPQDGSIAARVAVPFEDARGIGWWDDGLGVACHDSKRLLKLDPDTGEVVQEVSLAEPEWCEVWDFAQVNGELWIADGFNGLIVRREADGSGEPALLGLAGPEPFVISAAPDGVWHIDAFAPLIVKSGFKGELLQWGEKPFDRRREGLAWDGENLWALDNANHRICIIEKVE